LLISATPVGLHDDMETFHPMFHYICMYALLMSWFAFVRPK